MYVADQQLQVGDDVQAVNGSRDQTQMSTGLHTASDIHICVSRSSAPGMLPTTAVPAPAPRPEDRQAGAPVHVL